MANNNSWMWIVGILVMIIIISTTNLTDYGIFSISDMDNGVIEDTTIKINNENLEKLTIDVSESYQIQSQQSQSMDFMTTPSILQSSDISTIEIENYGVENIKGSEYRSWIQWNSLEKEKVYFLGFYLRNEEGGIARIYSKSVTFPQGMSLITTSNNFLFNMPGKYDAIFAFFDENGQNILKTTDWIEDVIIIQEIPIVQITGYQIKDYDLEDYVKNLEIKPGDISNKRIKILSEWKSNVNKQYGCMAYLKDKNEKIINLLYYLRTYSGETFTRCGFFINTIGDTLLNQGPDIYDIRFRIYDINGGNIGSILADTNWIENVIIVKEDIECVIAGCSGQVCTDSETAKGLITTCEFRPEYNCFKFSECGYFNEKCEWKKTEEYLKCVQDATTCKCISKKCTRT